MIKFFALCLLLPSLAIASTFEGSFDAVTSNSTTTNTLNVVGDAGVTGDLLIGGVPNGNSALTVAGDAGISGNMSVGSTISAGVTVGRNASVPWLTLDGTDLLFGYNSSGSAIWTSAGVSLAISAGSSQSVNDAPGILFNYSGGLVYQASGDSNLGHTMLTNRVLTGGDVVTYKNSTTVEGGLTYQGVDYNIGGFTTSATAGSQYQCTGAATCAVTSASGQQNAFDCGGGTCIASVGTTNATTTNLGRAGATTNLNGNVSIGSNLSSTNAGAITMSGGTGTATVRSGAHCVCSDTQGVLACQPSLSGTTLTVTVTGGGTNIVHYICL